MKKRNRERVNRGIVQRKRERKEKKGDEQQRKRKKGTLRHVFCNIYSSHYLSL